MPFADLSALRIHYDLHGDAGEPIVFVHGYTGDATDWDRQVERLAGDHRVLVFDNRGHGRSDVLADRDAYSVGHMVDDAMGLIDHVGLDRFHLVGHSIGGAVAQEIALLAPERLRSLTLLGTTHWFGDHDQPGGTPPVTPPEELRLAAERVERMSHDVLAGGWRGLLAWPGSTERAQEIRTPTLIVHGELDASRIVAGSRRLHALIPRAEYVVIEGAGHSPQRQCPEAFDAARARFLRDARGRRID